MAKHYGSNGKYIGSSHDDSYDWIFSLIIYGFVGAGLYALLNWGWEQATHWQTLEIPYKYIAIFYNYIIVIPAKNGLTLGNWLSSQEFTQYPNFNTVITGLGVVTYIFGLIFIVRVLMRALKYFDYESKIFWLILITPAVFGGIWFLLLELFQWITATA